MAKLRSIAFLIFFGVIFFLGFRIYQTVIGPMTTLINENFTDSDINENTKIPAQITF